MEHHTSPITVEVKRRPIFSEMVTGNGSSLSVEETEYQRDKKEMAFVWTMLFIGGSVLPTLCDAARDGMNRKHQHLHFQLLQLLMAFIWIMLLLEFVTRINMRRRLSVFTNFLPSSYRANVVYPTSYPSPNSAVEPSDDISHSYVDDADLNIAQPVNSFGDQESTSQNSNSELATIIHESTVHRLREDLVALGGDHAPMEENSNGGGPEGEKGIDMHDSLIVETGVRYQCSGSFNAGVQFRDTLVFEEGEDDDGGDGDNGGVFVAAGECTTSEDDLEEESDEETKLCNCS